MGSRRKSRATRIEEAKRKSRIVLNVAGAAWQDMVQRIPLSLIRTDEKRFQNRENAYSRKSHDSIVEAVRSGQFQEVLFDPIVLWQTDAGAYYVLSGHSRLAAFRTLSQEGRTRFQAIPAKVFRGSEAEAIDLALNSNTLSDSEQLWERANYYRQLRLKGVTKGEIQRKAKKEQGRNAPTLIALSYLHPEGVVIEHLRRFQGMDESHEDYIKLLRIARWVGAALEMDTDLSAQHEAQLFQYLARHDAKGTLEDFKKRIRPAVKEWKKSGGDADTRLNIAGAERVSENEKKLRGEIRALQAELLRLQNEKVERIDETERQIFEKHDWVHINSLEKRDALMREVGLAVAGVILKYKTQIMRVEEDIAALKADLGIASSHRQIEIDHGLFGVPYTLDSYLTHSRGIVMKTIQAKAGDELFRDYLDLADEDEIIPRALHAHWQWCENQKKANGPATARSWTPADHTKRYIPDNSLTHEENLARLKDWGLRRAQWKKEKRKNL